MKRIVILCDGTGQSASRGEYSVSTNVNRFSHALSNDGPVQQLIFYQSGIGTQDLSSWTKNVTSACISRLRPVLGAIMLIVCGNLERRTWIWAGRQRPGRVHVPHEQL
jgi:hypothetical protein